VAAVRKRRVAVLVDHHDQWEAHRQAVLESSHQVAAVLERPEDLGREEADRRLLVEAV
jgi:hypothetical protein